MHFVVSESFDMKDISTTFDMEVTPRIGQTLRMKSGKAFEVIDIEYCTTPDRGDYVRGKLRRVK